MAKSVFNLSASLYGQQESIISFSEKLINTLYDLSKLDTIFDTLQVTAQSNGFSKPIYLSRSQKENCIIDLSNAILDYSLPDIRKYDSIENPDIHYSRPYGFSFAINFSELITFTFVLGNVQSNGIGTISFSRALNKDFEWYFSLLKGVSESLDVIWSRIGLIETSFNEACRSYTTPIGWITYFSQEFKLKIPDDLDGVEYDYSSKKGKYLILTREDFTKDKESYEIHKQKILNLMDEIKRKIPEYAQ